MQKNWFDQRASLGSTEKISSSEARPARGRGSKTGTTSKETSKKPGQKNNIFFNEYKHSRKCENFQQFLYIIFY